MPPGRHGVVWHGEAWHTLLQLEKTQSRRVQRLAAAEREQLVVLVRVSDGR